jgi:HEPN domain-containing protein
LVSRKDAESDLKTLKTLIDNEGPYDTACFHAQQVVERCLKAFLAFHEKKIPKIHDLEELQRLCLEITMVKELQELDLSEITDYAVEMRYDLEFWPEQNTVDDALKIAEKVKKIILDHLPEECHPK